MAKPPHTTTTAPQIKTKALHMITKVPRIMTKAPHTAVSRKVVQQNRTRQCRKVLWVMGVYGI